MPESENEKRRGAFRPSPVQLLFVGEAPPVSGRFFYNGDSGLYRAMRDAFRIADPSTDDQNFLRRFQAAGCYLTDLCGYPVDQLETKARRATCTAGEPRLTKIIRDLQPDMIATLVRSIEPNVKRAASRAAWNGPFLHLPYPGRWISHRKIFTEDLIPVIRKLLR